MTPTALLDKVVIVTRMQRIPNNCQRCPYYDSMGGSPGGQYNDGVCWAKGVDKAESTRYIRISSERLPTCPLVKVGAR